MKKRPYLDETIEMILEGETKEIARDFATFLRENKIRLKRAYGEHHWSSTGKSYGGGGLCSINLLDGKKKLYTGIELKNIAQYEETVISEELQDFVLSGIKYYCGCTTRCCRGEGRITVFGKEIAGICKIEMGDNLNVDLSKIELADHVKIYFNNPDRETMAKLIRLLELELSYAKGR